MVYHRILNTVLCGMTLLLIHPTYTGVHIHVLVSSNPKIPIFPSATPPLLDNMSVLCVCEFVSVL